MTQHGFIKVAAAYPHVALADPATNAERIIEMLGDAAYSGCRLTVFPELCITGYTSADLFNQHLLLDKALEALAVVARSTTGTGLAAVVGLPVMIGTRLFNCAAMCADGKVCGIVPKTHIPNYNEFYERRWFSQASLLDRDTTSLPHVGTVPVGTDLIFEVDGANVGIEICEDLWVPVPPSGRLACCGAEIIVNISATDENIGKYAYLAQLVKQQSARCRGAYIYASAGRGESSTDLVFSGNAIIAEDGAILASSPRFSRDANLVISEIDVERLRGDRRKFSSYGDTPDTAVRHIMALPKMDEPISFRLTRRVDPHPFVDEDPATRDANCNEIISIQTWGLMQRLEATGCKCLVVGISGGLDSTLALLVAVNAFRTLGLDLKGIIGVTMPGYGTTTRTHSNAQDLMRLLGVTALEIPIGPAVDRHFLDIGQSKEVHDATYENGQARERTQILMDLANKNYGMVLGTGDLSELALGWCTYNGDHMSMYGVNASIPKTLVRHLVGWFAAHAGEKTAAVLRDIIDTPISPELIPADDGGDKIEQKTEDLVGPYELHDFFIFHTLRNGFTPSKVYWLARLAFEGVYDNETLLKWLKNFYRRFFSQQFKRSCMPDGPKVGSVCLSPRGDWRMPSDASSRLWLAEVENLC